MEGYPWCLEGYNLMLAMATAAILNLVMHIILMRAVVPMFDKEDHQVSETPYSEAAATLASTWFTENPVHCLRSKYVYKHDPPCLFNTKGKEYLMKQNKDAGCYFESSNRIGADEYDD
jgi:hypothetical protein